MERRVVPGRRAALAPRRGGGSGASGSQETTGATGAAAAAAAQMSPGPPSAPAPRCRPVNSQLDPSRWHLIRVTFPRSRPGPLRRCRLSPRRPLECQPRPQSRRWIQGFFFVVVRCQSREFLLADEMLQYVDLFCDKTFFLDDRYFV